jgi:acyl-coenzyme A synthetase/AMP-(fatty) acid ligase/acyl carrier protein
VALPHRGLANLVAWHLRAYEQGADDRTTLVAAPAFDAAVWELWPTLAAGGALAVPAREVAASPRRLLHWLNERRVTLCFLPTPLAEAMLRQPDAAPPSLRCLLVGGDKLHRLDFDRLPYRVVNHYGPTESSVVATAGVAGTSPEDPPIGRPIDGVRAYVLDDRQRLVPVGVPGELAVAGRSLARGYLGRPGLTAERFLPDPRSGAGGRLYRTGDLVRRRPDGALDFLGRIDHQVKVRGYRIELGEVEAVLREQPGVAEAVVRVLADGGPQRLVGYVVADGDGEVDAEEVRRAARLRLPDYMVPSAVVSIPEVPLTANGKVDRAALPAPASGDGAAGFVAPRDEMERSLAGIWRQVLRVEEVGVHDNFFDLGGHSLLLAEVQVRLEESLDRSVSMLELFRYTTIASLAERLGDGGERAPRTDLDQLRDRAARQQAALSAGRDAARRVQRRRTENV